MTPAGWSRLGVSILAPVLIAAALIGVGAYGVLRFVVDPLRSEVAENRKALSGFVEAVKNLRPGETAITVNPATGTTGQTTIIERDRTTIKTETVVRDQIPPSQLDSARARARKIVTVDLNPEALVPSFQAHKRIELIEDPGTGVFSPVANPVVSQVTTTQNLALFRPRVFSIEPYVAVGYIAGGAELGIGADLIHLGDVSLGADLRVARWVPNLSGQQSFSFGLYHAVIGASVPLGGVRFQAGYAFSFNPSVPSGPAVGFLVRF